MKKTAIICELNPIHPGHGLVLSLAKNENDITIAVMSGNFTQRGIPAVYDKYVRAETAIAAGADLVVELPFPWCSSGTEFFALGGAAAASGCLADSLTFGSESGSLDLPMRLADIKASPDYAQSIIQAEREGRGRGSAVIFEEILKKYGIDANAGANDRLAGEYIRFGREMGITEFKPVKRMTNAPSAMAVREILYSEGLSACGNLIVREAYPVFEKAELCRCSALDEIFFTHCRLYVSAEEENTLLRYAAKSARLCRNAGEFTAGLATKKYTLARMRRELLFAILGVKPEDYTEKPGFTQLLAANEKGRAYISEFGKNFRIPLITKPADQSSLDEIAKHQYELHRKADELYAFLMGKTADTFIKRHPVIVK